jgi:hypothetical protein
MRKMSRSISRRVLLESAAFSLGVAAACGAPRPALAQETPEADKIKQAEAHYQNQPKGQQRCEICLQFMPPNRCKIVQGPINPKGWCQFFAARENAH